MKISIYPVNGGLQFSHGIHKHPAIEESISQSYQEIVINVTYPMSGGVAPLYNPLTPSLRTVCNRQSSGPLNWAFSVVCRRTLMVSKLLK